MHIDFLCITTKDTCGDAWDDAVRVKGYLGGEWREGNGRNGYRRSFIHESGATILYDGGENMGLHLVLPSAALAYFSERLGDLLEDFNWQASRIDIAADTEKVSVQQIVDNQDWIVTRAQGRILIQDLVSGGMTLYVGTPGHSRKLVRIYDKGVEQKTHPPGQLTRIEVQLRGGYAKAAFEFIRCGGSLADVMKRSIDFRLPDRSRKCERPRLEWWNELVGSGKSGFAFPVRLRAAEVIEDVRRWIEKQVAPSLAKCHISLGENWLRSLLFRGSAKLDVSFYASTA